jgi:hypothetical protein
MFSFISLKVSVLRLALSNVLSNLYHNSAAAMSFLQHPHKQATASQSKSLIKKPCILLQQLFYIQW